MLAAVVSSVSADALFVPGQYATINEAIKNASDGDIIEVEPGVYTENLVVSNKNIAIRGSQILGPTVIDGSSPVNDCGSCILVLGGSLVIDHLVLRNGSGCPVFGITRGGGIYAEFATVEVINSVIEDCVLETEPFGSTTWGGGVCSYFGSLTIEGSTIRNNVVDGEGGGVWCTQSTLLVANSRITDNTAALGGGFLVAGGEASIDISSIHGNTALENGGGVFVGDEADVQIFDTRFDSNVAPNGAGVWTNVVNGSIVDSFFSNNVSGPGGATVRLDDLTLLGGDYLIGGNTFCGSTGSDINGEWVEGDPNVFLETCSPTGDLDGDGIVGGSDLTILLGDWGTDGRSSGADLDFDGLVDGADLTMLLGNWSN